MNKDLAMMDLFLDRDALIDATHGDGFSESALHFACKMGHLETVQMLLDHGANIGAIGQCGLCEAKHTEEEYLETIAGMLKEAEEALAKYK
ncbi:hypothetical protein C8R44DRAFT_894355 [Mycena epipterygia]|nr:hypothetical protein C8R44DRAFT_894355 [Mycena epipterygia]